MELFPPNVNFVKGFNYQKMFRLIKKDKLEYYTIDAFEKTGLVRHCFSTKRGGVSDGVYTSMNLRFNCDDKRENVEKNFEILCGGIGIDVKNAVLSNQVHEDKIVSVGKKDCGNGLFFENKFLSADGLITDEPEVALITFYADCVPVFFLDKKKRVIASVHSGWRGTVARIAGKAVDKFRNDYHSRPEDILVGIGPSIRKCHFEVGEDVAEIFRKEFGEDTVTSEAKKPHVDMQKAVVKTLSESGILNENITDSGICTYCNSDLLFSHRKTMGKRGNLAAVISLNP